MAYKPARRISLREQEAQSRAAMRSYATTPEQLAKIAADFPEPAPKRQRAPNKPREGLSELQEQIRVVKWFDSSCYKWGLLPLHLFHIPNGGSRQKIESSLLKMSGVRPGIPDLFLAVPNKNWHGLFIEMKAWDGKESPDQTHTLDTLRMQGFRCVTEFNHMDAISTIEKHLSLI